MPAPQATRWSAAEYAEAARRYLETLPPEHFMEAITQSTQSRMSEASFEVYHADKQRYRLLAELLVQYFFEGNLRQVCPDNMLVLGHFEERHRTSWDAELETAAIVLVMEYVSANNRRKDYVDSYTKYERELKVPFYLTVDHERHDLRLHRLTADGYGRVEPNDQGRYDLPELELEIGWQGEWVRFWHKGELLPTTSELDQQVRQRDQQLQHRDEQLQQSKEQLQQRDQQLQQRDEQLQQSKEQLSSLIQSLRPLVEAKARLLNRQDVLDQLPATNDANLLARWLAELT